MGLDSIVSVTITSNTVVPTRVGFGTPLILDYTNRFTNSLTRVYSSTLAMIADGFTTADAAYKMAVAIFSQNPKVKQVRVGRAASIPQQEIVITPVVVDSTTYSVKLGATTRSFTSGVGTDAATIVAGLVAAIGTTEGVTATATGGGNTMTLTGTAGTPFELTVNRALLTQVDTTNDPGWVANLQAIQLENDDFYTVHPTFHGASIVEALAAYVETQKKILITEGGDDTEPLGTGIGAALKLAGYARTVFSYSSKPWQYLGAAWAGKTLPFDPGSLTWKFKTLAGITPETLTDTEVANLESKNVNYYQSVAGINIMQQGVSSSGEFVDITQGSDWLAQRMKERIFTDLANSPKIPFTDPGIAVIESDVRAQLKEGVNVGFLAADPKPVVTVPKAADVSAADKATRTLTGVEFSATLAGAIHSVEITGTVSV